MHVHAYIHTNIETLASLQGEVSLRNVELKPSAFDSFNLPVTVTHGVIGTYLLFICLGWDGCVHSLSHPLSRARARARTHTQHAHTLSFFLSHSLSLSLSPSLCLVLSLGVSLPLSVSPSSALDLSIVDTHVYAAAHCISIQFTAATETHCNALQRMISLSSIYTCILQLTATHYNSLQRLQRTATQRHDRHTSAVDPSIVNIHVYTASLQPTATHCNTLQLTGAIDIRVPWTSLSSSPVQVELSNVRICIAPNSVTTTEDQVCLGHF